MGFTGGTGTSVFDEVTCNWAGSADTAGACSGCVGAVGGSSLGFDSSAGAGFDEGSSSHDGASTVVGSSHPACAGSDKDWDGAVGSVDVGADSSDVAGAGAGGAAAGAGGAC